MTSAEFQRNKNDRMIAFYKYVLCGIKKRIDAIASNSDTRTVDYLSSAIVCLQSAITFQERSINNFAIASYKIAENLLLAVGEDIYSD